MVDPEFVHRPRSLRHDLSETIQRNEPAHTYPRSNTLLLVRFRLDVGFLEKPRNWNGLCDLGRRRLALIAIIGILFFGESFPWGKIVGLALVIVGVILLKISNS